MEKVEIFSLFLDGGEGFAGILREINFANNTAIVQWDNGNQIQCRVGFSDKYDLRIIDNAQIGKSFCEYNYVPRYSQKKVLNLPL